MQTLMITAQYNDINSLYTAYMPFVKNGALFIPTTDEFTFGEEVEVTVDLLGDLHTFIGTIVWYTPPGAQHGLKQGIGVQLSSDDKIKNKIESLLSTFKDNTTKTDTI